ncbi:hypothetical protein JCM5296_007500 [Sporobolomyces johnsonii]
MASSRQSSRSRNPSASTMPTQHPSQPAAAAAAAAAASSSTPSSSSSAASSLAPSPVLSSHAQPYASTSTSSVLPPPTWQRPAPHPDPQYVNAPDLSHYLEANFVPSVVPQPDEYQAKEQARQFLEKLADQVSPGAKLLPFGSMANGFALKNSDMDLCCFLGKDAPVRGPSELVELLGGLIERETNFYVKMLPRARIPIIKLTMPPTPSVPAGMACDIGFENRLALENTRLLLTYAMVDPRLRTLVLFLKVWTKRRKINNPYRGTLSSYGYVLLVIHFLAHVKQPPVLPNLQRLPLPHPTPLEELTYEGHDISFFDDLELLPSVFQSLNTDSSGELLVDFFRYFAKSFDYAHSVISVRSEKGVLGKEQKGWHTDIEFDPEMIVRDLHKLCIEDPFALDYNVARTVTRDGLYTIRGEFMRAFRLLTHSTSRSPSADRITALITELCAEREDFLLMHPPPEHYHPHQQQPKSPRRRSAPSPRMGPTLQGGAQGQPPVLKQGKGDHPLWQAAMGNGAVPVVGVGAGAAEGAKEASRAAEREEAGAGTGFAETLEPAPATLHPHAPRRHLQPTSLTRPAPLQTSAPPHPPPPTSGTAPSSSASSVAGDVVSTSVLTSTMSSLERRVSWDGGSGAGPSKGSVANGQAGGPSSSTAAAGANGGYDLHRFFQNPPSSSMSDVGAPTSSMGPLHPNPRGPVSLTAPSSPDLSAASSAYFAGHPPATSYAAGGYAGRSPYRFASSGSHATVGPRLAASVPRANPHTAHHAYTNPYAAAPTPAPPYPLASSSSSSASLAYPIASHPHPHPHPHPHQQPHPAPPAPIFPEEDRETIALANSITFGNFPELLPLPSYAHYHASGGSAAYLNGGGGWGMTPYGMGGGGRLNGGNGAGRRVGYDGARRGMRRSLGTLSDDGEEGPGGEGVIEEEEDGQGGEGGAPSRGRRPPAAMLNGGGYRHGLPALVADDAMLPNPPDRQPRQRGRSVPHTRMGPDGRESILFGAIEVTLPRAEDVQAAEEEEEEREIAFLGPAPDAEGEDKAATEEEIPPKAVMRVIPVLTTQPPTPAKTPTPTVAVAASAESPARARNRSPSPLVVSQSAAGAEPTSPREASSDRATPRPSSPSSSHSAPPTLPNGSSSSLSFPASPPRVPIPSPPTSPRPLSLRQSVEDDHPSSPPQSPPRKSSPTMAKKSQRQQEQDERRQSSAGGGDADLDA